MGRVAIYEILTMSNDIRKHITANTSLTDLHAAAMKQDMHSLRTAAAQKIAEGMTTLEEVYSVMPQRDE
jgi:general secretion pathway protein E